MLDEFSSYSQPKPKNMKIEKLKPAMTKTNTKEEIEPTSGEPVVVRKVSAADKVFMEGHFKVFIDRCRWDQANDVQQRAMLHRALMRVNVQSSDKGIKIGTRKPDVVTFQATIVRFGACKIK